jgi:hypothetical protein
MCVIRGIVRCVILGLAVAAGMRSDSLQNIQIWRQQKSDDNVHKHLYRGLGLIVTRRI